MNISKPLTLAERVTLAAALVLLLPLAGLMMAREVVRTPLVAALFHVCTMIGGILAAVLSFALAVYFSAGLQRFDLAAAALMAGMVFTWIVSLQGDRA